MKKILGMLTVVVFAMTLSLNSNSSEINLSSLTSMNTAEAESCSGTGCGLSCEFFCFQSWTNICDVPGEALCVFRRAY